MTSLWPETPPPTAEEVAARVRTERRGHVLVVRMARTDKRNAVDAAMTTALDRALDTLDDDPELRCGVLTGGPEVFCAGTDIAVGPGAPTPRGGNYGVVARRRTTPLVAAVEGIAFGGGFEIALACDVLVAGRTARFGLPEVGLGLVANCGALFRGPRALPPVVARQMLLTGDPIDAERAHALGLVGDLTAPGQAEEHALALAERIAARSPVAVAATLTALDAALQDADAQGWADTEAAVARVLASEDRVEGVAAFFAKRPPVFPGR
ncbi:enoyl-CoA hydratase-related protein [Actinomycetospora straminea]|uniref:Crotonase/enoyl-CoA hydratase family protein n=1 Tax=Actinomycetospora straminea TaxID=663607 RepID=A0ABP9F063_9PSEU|nr:enoyl-CoA hydratase-related protein [Actinomycetospora straminea]MDD7935775.1 enoyl-CoA hydratase-related protein [Actinomycetospora straminea]